MIVYLPNLRGIFKEVFKGMKIRFRNSNEDNVILIKVSSIEEREKVNQLIPIVREKLANIKIEVL